MACPQFIRPTGIADHDRTYLMSLLLQAAETYRYWPLLHKVVDLSPTSTLERRSCRGRAGGAYWHSPFPQRNYLNPSNADGAEGGKKRGPNDATDQPGRTLL